MQNRIALGIKYDGTRYHGWQRQIGLSSIQECLEDSLKKLTNEEIKVFCGGRTDAGVHALGQVVHFETSKIRKDSVWISGVNHYLPRDISVSWKKNVSYEFHARFSAISRYYRYIIFNAEVRPAVLYSNVFHVPERLDHENMNEAAQLLLGEQDFCSFISSDHQNRSTTRNIQYACVRRSLGYVIVDIQANSFAYNMVRNIVGSLIEIGKGKRRVEWIGDLIKMRDRTKSGPKINSRGLYLVCIEYPKKFDLPNYDISSSLIVI
ncbi:tRNA pseudouridine(38-40) synthase TruA [Candidatus Riesia pediculischaeffi]|uniref:tRNA pseudouridine synthase A n=2 Tax=Candidatus Riesia pediculischaeffi TaxID=428411 RepID=A0A1V0HK13_9ENTR|nr:tRNA pseudouridine(38-40) synthase TruA [Candidatus Riesia pediculischaeffi]ARC53170.1 tRNA pseudouridine synthase A [Candidatus Riesia pediculischaeffi]KIE64198.1 tRNA pseudouridine synthase A [Candidatus Riesia pediculischaeffi PTSU]